MIKSFFHSKPLLALLLSLPVAALALRPSASAQTTATLTTLYNFTGGADGHTPVGGLVQAGDGSFYGTTESSFFGTVIRPPDGRSSYAPPGTVFRLTASGTLTTISGSQAPVGFGPQATLQLAGDGNFYGAANNNASPVQHVNDFGYLFRVTPDGTLTTLYTFPTEASPATAALIQDSDGNFYGTTPLGGAAGAGSIYKFTPDGTVTLLHSFTTTTSDGTSADGSIPQAGLIQASDGNLYGTTPAGGANGYGTIFRLTPDGTFTVLHDFYKGTGASPYSALIQARDGYLYGTTYGGGTSNDNGTIFRMSLDGTSYKVMHNFTGYDGGSSLAGLLEATDGNLYGVASTGGASSGGHGVVFQMTPAGTFSILHVFTTDGTKPSSPLVQAKDGSFYGTTAGDGGGIGFGTIFRFTVDATGHPPFFTGAVALSSGVYYLNFPASSSYFGYYSFLTDPNYIYHFDLGYEYVFDANDSKAGVYLYDFKSNGFFYTSPAFPFPYLYDFNLNSTVYYYPDPTNPGRYNTDGIRYFYEFANGQIISK